jgi:hypothetical protein
MTPQRFSGWLALSLVAALAGPWCRAADQAAAMNIASYAVHPTALNLRHPRQPHSVQVLGTTADGFSLDLRDEACFASADPRVATVDEHGTVRSAGSGETRVTVTVAGRTVNVPVTVRLPAVEPPISFRHEVMPVLSRAGCNMGACHGYSLGKNGFKLSLRGSDPELDYPAIVRDTFGRRVNALTPGASLLVAKPRGDVPHEGGVRFPRGSPSDHILRTWVRQGAPADLSDPVRVVRVSLVPDTLVLRPGQRHRLQVIAQYSDGATRDVTPLAIFNANNDRYAAVDGDGVVTAADVGETAVIARFERTFASAAVVTLRADPHFVATPVPRDNLIDRHVVEKLNRMKISPSPLATDEEFLRRVYLDLIGVQPRPDEVRAFLADRDPAKRLKVAEALFGRPEFVDHWSLKWGDLLQNSRTSVSQPSVYLFREFLRAAVASNLPLDQFARRIITARGGAVEDPASVYFALSRDTYDTVERVTQVFCGVRVQCARCHSHPMENWTQADYHGLVSFFNQLSVRPDVRPPSPQPGMPTAKVVLVNPAAGPATHPRTGRPQPPKFLGGAVPELPPGVDRRDAFARWLTAPANPFFARGLVNRFWSYFFHRGLIDPVDDVRSTNPPIQPALLAALTDDFIVHGFDVRHLMRHIVSSATYQRSSVPTAANRHDEQNFSHALPRRVPAEALLDSLVQATGVREAFAGAPADFRAAQLPDGNIDNPFLKLFGKPARQDACECERDNGSNLLQALHLINGKSILGRVQDPAARPAVLLKQKLSDEELVTELYLWSLARHPRAEERKIGLAFLTSSGDRKVEAAQDLMWALLNSRDFLLVP